FIIIDGGRVAKAISDTDTESEGGLGSNGRSQAAEGSEGRPGAVEQTVVDFAEDLGRFLGTAETKATAWLDQRKTVLEQLTMIRDKAANLIHMMSGENP